MGWKHNGTPEGKARWRAAKKRRHKERLVTDSVYRKRFNLRKMLRANYDISLEDYQFLQKIQEDKCAICGLEPKPDERRLAVDHNHKTDYIRGLLCRGCNVGLGNFKEDVRLLQRAIDYLNARGSSFSE